MDKSHCNTQRTDSGLNSGNNQIVCTAVAIASALWSSQFAATLLRWTHLHSSSQKERPTASGEESLFCGRLHLRVSVGLRRLAEIGHGCEPWGNNESWRFPDSLRVRFLSTNCVGKGYPRYFSFSTWNEAASWYPSGERPSRWTVLFQTARPQAHRSHRTGSSGRSLSEGAGFRDLKSIPNLGRPASHVSDSSSWHHNGKLT